MSCSGASFWSMEPPSRPSRSTTSRRCASRGGWQQGRRLWTRTGLRPITSLLTSARRTCRAEARHEYFWGSGVPRSVALPWAPG
eukprot:1969742-Prymnesium_polylepis.1